jgi:TPP-dependent pyruvate/acetoin dehydrogenase alpha subunit
MTTSFTTASGSERLELARTLGLEPEALIRAFRLMQTSRLLDDREILLQRQKRIFFQISGAGHEAIQVAAGLVSRPRHGLIGEAGSFGVGSSNLCRSIR